MKTFLSFLSIITLSTLATAQIPTCASACIANAVISAAPSRGVSNLVCQCQPNTLPVIVEAATPCVLDNCTNPIAVLQAADAACSSILASTSSPTSTSTSTPPIPTPAPSSSSAAASASAAQSTDQPTAASPTDPPTAVNPSSDPSSAVTTDPVLSTSSALSNGTATTSSSPVQVSASAGVKFGLEKAASMLAVGMAVLATF